MELQRKQRNRLGETAEKNSVKLKDFLGDPKRKLVGLTTGEVEFFQKIRPGHMTTSAKRKKLRPTSNCGICTFCGAVKMLSTMFNEDGVGIKRVGLTGFTVDNPPEKVFCTRLHAGRYGLRNAPIFKPQPKPEKSAGKCEYCGTMFAPRNKRQRFCSTSCAMKASWVKS